MSRAPTEDEVPTVRPTAARDEGSGGSAIPRPATRGRAEIARRRADVAAWLGCAVPSATIVARLMEQNGVSRRTAEADLAAVRTEWIAAIQREEPQRRAALLAILDGVLHGAIVDRSWSSAVAAVREIARICGLGTMNIAVGGYEVTTLTPLRFTEPVVAAEASGLAAAVGMRTADRLAAIDAIEADLANDNEGGNHDEEA